MNIQLEVTQSLPQSDIITCIIITTVEARPRSRLDKKPSALLTCICTSLRSTMIPLFCLNSSHSVCRNEELLPDVPVEGKDGAADPLCLLMLSLLCAAHCEAGFV